MVIVVIVVVIVVVVVVVVVDDCCGREDEDEDDGGMQPGEELLSYAELIAKVYIYPLQHTQHLHSHTHCCAITHTGHERG